MKKRLIVGLSVFLVLFLMAGVVYAANPIKIIINGVEVKSDVAPFTKNGRTMVPIRVISEYLGATVTWDAKNNAVIVTTPTPKSEAIVSFFLMSGEDNMADRIYLGELTSDKYDTDSVFNEYGTYGSKYSSKSIWNKYGSYGSKYSSTSAFNDYATNPPIIYGAAEKGMLYIGRLSTNISIKNSYTVDIMYEFLVKSGY